MFDVFDEMFFLTNSTIASLLLVKQFAVGLVLKLINWGRVLSVSCANTQLLPSQVDVKITEENWTHNLFPGHPVGR